MPPRRASRVRLSGGLLLAAVVVTLCGCPCQGPPSKFPTADDAFDRMKATFECANGVQGEGKIDHFSPQGRVRGDATLFAVNPARVRIDVISSLGALIYSLTSNGRTFRMFDHPNKQFLHGPASACNLARLTQVPVPGYALVYLLRGEAPLLVHEPRQARLSWDCGHYQIDIDSKHQARQEVHLEVWQEDWLKPWQEQRVRVTYLKTVQQDIVLYEASLSDHKVTGTAPPRVDPDGLEDDIPPSGGACNIEIPYTIQVQVPHTDDDVIFEYQKAAVNPPIPEGAFSQPVPGGVQKIYVTCEDHPPRPATDKPSPPKDH